MSRRGRVIVIIIIFVLLIAIGIPAVIQAFGRHVDMNPASVRGNTPGNLYNGGYFCESDGTVFFSNLADGGSLYSMTSQETDYKKLSSISASNILSGGKFLYFYMDAHSRAVTQGLGSVVREYGIYRIRRDGKYNVCLLREVAQTMQLGGSYLYFMQGDDISGSLERIRIDKKDRTSYVSEHINPAAYENGYIYYNAVSETHHLYQMSVEGEAPRTQQIADTNAYQPVISGSDIFYLDAAAGYRICRYHVPTGTNQVLSDIGADAWNMNGTHIFFDSQTADIPGLYRMRTDGSELTLLSAGICNSIHLTSTHLYFRMYGADDLFYHMPLNGNAAPSAFLPETR